MLAGKIAAQAWRRFADIPKCLLPKRSSAGTVSPINAPATYQGQGCFNSSIIFQYCFKECVEIPAESIYEYNDTFKRYL
jgi:hypothetical protein